MAFARRNRLANPGAGKTPKAGRVFLGCWQVNVLLGTHQVWAVHPPTALPMRWQLAVADRAETGLAMSPSLRVGRPLAFASARIQNTDR